MTKTVMQRCSEKEIEWKKLFLDPGNPRFYTKLGNKILKLSYEEIIDKQEEIFNNILSDKRNAKKLELSFLNNGYIKAEPMIVLEIFNKKGFYVVKEGNRRLTVIKSILNSEDKIKGLKKGIKESLEKIPCFILPADVTEIEVLEILSARHLAGTLHWGTSERNIAIAELYQRLLREEEVGIRESSSTILTELAEKTTISSPQAAAKYLLAVFFQSEVINEGMKILEHINQKEKNSFMKKEILEKLQLDMFTEAMNNQSFKNWLNIVPNLSDYLESKILNIKNFSKYVNNILRNIITSGKNHQRAYIQLMTQADTNEEKYTARIETYYKSGLEPTKIIERVYSEYISTKPDKSILTVKSFLFFIEDLESEKIKSNQVLKEKLAILLELLKKKLEVS